MGYVEGQRTKRVHYDISRNFRRILCCDAVQLLAFDTMSHHWMIHSQSRCLYLKERGGTRDLSMVTFILLIYYCGCSRKVSILFGLEGLNGDTHTLDILVRKLLIPFGLEGEKKALVT